MFTLKNDEICLFSLQNFSTILSDNFNPLYSVISALYFIYFCLDLIIFISRAGTDIVSKGAKDRVAYYLQSQKQHFADCLTDIRQNLAAPRLVGKQDSSARLAELLSNMQSSVIEQIKSVMSNLQVSFEILFTHVFLGRPNWESLIFVSVNYVISKKPH